MKKIRKPTIKVKVHNIKDNNQATRRSMIIIKVIDMVINPSLRKDHSKIRITKRGIFRGKISKFVNKIINLRMEAMVLGSRAKGLQKKELIKM